MNHLVNPPCYARMLWGWPLSSGAPFLLCTEFKALAILRHGRIQGHVQKRQQTETIQTPLGLAANRTTIPLTVCSFSYGGVCEKWSVCCKGGLQLSRMESDDGALYRIAMLHWQFHPVALRAMALSRHPLDGVDCKLYRRRVRCAHRWAAECPWSPLNEHRGQIFQPILVCTIGSVSLNGWQILQILAQRMLRVGWVRTSRRKLPNRCTDLDSTDLSWGAVLDTGKGVPHAIANCGQRWATLGTVEQWGNIGAMEQVSVGGDRMALWSSKIDWVDTRHWRICMDMGPCRIL